jgi:hypothetical protein
LLWGKGIGWQGKFLKRKIQHWQAERERERERKRKVIREVKDTSNERSEKDKYQDRAKLSKGVRREKQGKEQKKILE